MESFLRKLPFAFLLLMLPCLLFGQDGPPVCDSLGTNSFNLKQSQDASGQISQSFYLVPDGAPLNDFLIQQGMSPEEAERRQQAYLESTKLEELNRKMKAEAIGLDNWAYHDSDHYNKYSGPKKDLVFCFGDTSVQQYRSYLYVNGVYGLSTGAPGHYKGEGGKHLLSNAYFYDIPEGKALKLLVFYWRNGSIFCHYATYNSEGLDKWIIEAQACSEEELKAKFKQLGTLAKKGEIW